MMFPLFSLLSLLPLSLQPLSLQPLPLQPLLEVSPQPFSSIHPSPVVAPIASAPFARLAQSLDNPNAISSAVRNAGEVLQRQDVRPLPGSLDAVPVFNSNNPEVIRGEGILLSTFPSRDKRVPAAHLNYPFEGRFDIFTHHVTQAKTSAETRTLFQGTLLHNPGNEAIRVEVLQASTYMTRPDALYVPLAPYIEDPIGQVYSGPGSRITGDILRGRRQGLWPATIRIPPKQSYMLMNLPIPVGKVTPSSNGRSTIARLWSSGSVYVANMALRAPLDEVGRERTPNLADWETLARNGDLVQPRDHSASPPGTPPEDIVFSRVSGVAKGSHWRARITDGPEASYLTIPDEGSEFSYGLSLLPKGTLGTGQIQSAPMLARYPDSAYAAHGNYGIEYNLLLPLGNPHKQTKTVGIAIQTPIKKDQAEGGLSFLNPDSDKVFFRGTVRLRYIDDRDQLQTRYVHLVQRRGEQGKALVFLNLKPGERRVVRLDLIYPPDATPPQVLTVKTVDAATARRETAVLSEVPISGPKQFGPKQFGKETP